MEPFRVAFVVGATPDKWARAWRERRPEPLELTMVDQADQERVLRDGEADAALVRLPLDRECLHLIPLYEERPVVVVSQEHPVAAYDEIGVGDLADEQFALGVPEGLDAVEQLPFPPMTAKDAVEVAASGTAVIVLPMSVARLHHRKDVVAVPVTGLPPTTVGLAWLVEADDERIQEWIGIVRGRTARSSRGATPPAPARSRRPEKASPSRPRRRGRRRA
jgi:DNA-binding transcriptional LysR family regulator